MKDILHSRIWDSRIKSDTVAKKERMLGYQAPGLDGTIPVQTRLVQNFFTFGAVGAQAPVFPVIALVLLRSPDDRKKAGK